MRTRHGARGWVVVTALALAGCPGKPVRPEPPAPVAPAFTSVPTVAPTTPTPVSTPGPLRTRPIKDERAAAAGKQAGKDIGPVITFLGISRADGVPVTPVAVDKNGVPTYENFVGSGFQLVVEAKPGISNVAVGRRVFAHDPEDPTSRPDLEIQVNRPLGDGSRAVCDRRRPNIGGIPAIDPPSFKETQAIADALNDLSCRFETFIEPESSCVLNQQGDFAFMRPDSVTQFCMTVARAWNFQVGDTLVSARLRDEEGHPGPVAHFRLRRTQRPPRSTRMPAKTPTPPRRHP